MIKRFVIAAILLVLVVGGIVWFNLFRDQMIAQFFANMPRPELTVSTEEVKATAWTPEIEALGTVNARQGVNLTVETTGIVKDILFKANERVEAGQILVQLDDAVERAELEAGKATAANTKLVLDRALELQRREVGSVSRLDEARALATSSQAQVAKQQAVLDQKQLKAPFAGTVGIPKIDDGQYVQPGTTVVTIQDLETMRVDFTVPEQRLAELKIGQAVRLGVTNENLAFAGKVTGIDPRVDPASRLVSVRAEVSNPQGKLTPGQFVQVRVLLDEAPDVLAVQQTVVVTSLYGDYVYVVKPATAEPQQSAPAGPDAPKPADAPAKEPEATASVQPADAKPALVANQVFVKTGRRSEGMVEVVSGLKPGDVVVTAGQNRLSNGAPVKVDNTVTLDAKVPSQ